jgi:hypothetical protein
MKDMYTAGLFDGEGTVTLGHQHSKKQQNCFRVPHVEIPSTTIQLVEFLKKNYGGCICKKKVYEEHHKQSWTWRLNYDAALNFLEKIKPFVLVPEKLYRINLILTEYKKLTKRNGKYTSKEANLKLNFEERFFHPSTPLLTQ